jgi:CHAT domain-containing protein/tetratricopeptide (TPR) repeat protein
MVKLLGEVVARKTLLRAGCVLVVGALALAASMLPFLAGRDGGAPVAEDRDTATEYQIRRLGETTAQRYSAGDFRSAAESAEKWRAAAERKFGPRHPRTMQAQGMLALAYSRLGRYAEAEPLFLQAREILSKTLGAEDAETLRLENNLATLYADTGNYEKAEPLLRRVLGTMERVRGKDDPDTLSFVNNLAVVLQQRGRYREAEDLLARVLDARRRTLGPDDAATIMAENNLATGYREQGRLTEAEAMFRRAVEAYERTLGPDHPKTLVPVTNLAAIYRELARYEDAARLYRRVHAANLRIYGEAHKLTLESGNLLASMYLELGRYREAEDLLVPAVAEARKVYGRKDPISLESAHYLGVLRGKLLPQVLDLGELAKGGVLANDLLRTVVTDRAEVLGDGHRDTLASINALGTALLNEGYYPQAVTIFEAALKIIEITRGAEDELALGPLNNLAYLRYLQKDWPAAAQLWKRSLPLAMARMRRGTLRIGEPGDGSAEHLRRPGIVLLGTVRAVRRMVEAGTMHQQAAIEAFQIAQGALQSDAGRSLVQMAARQASGNRELSTLAREQQDLTATWQTLAARRASELGSKGKRDPEAEAALSARMADVRARLTTVDGTLTRMFPAYSALVNPAPLSVADVKALLKPDEALVLFLDFPEWHGAAEAANSPIRNTLAPAPGTEETLIWVVTKDQVAWVRSRFGTAALKREVSALRCGLDNSLWDGGGKESCAKALNMAVPKEVPDRLPFPVARAHALYKALFGEVEKLIAGKHLLVVPSGALTQLPFHVLVTDAPAVAVRPGGSDRRAKPSLSARKNKGGATGSDPHGLPPVVAWLARRHAITVLPAVSSLKALRRVGEPSAAARPMIAFGNPLLDGYSGEDRERAGREARWAAQARANARCPVPATQQVASLAGKHSGITRVPMRGGLADLAHLKMQVPLPETAEELCAVAAAVGADADEVHLAAGATERKVKQLSRDGELVKYRMLHFATHGALAGELSGTSEPGLMLTPPNAPSEEDDGYLSASEIAALKLDADWVILSACNTAAGGAANAEALSGLARAFIYAGARALLVSHWPVYSEATKTLVTGAIREMARDGHVGRAEALRRAMLALADSGDPAESHPAYWAPFVVVGEGAAAGR